MSLKLNFLKFFFTKNRIHPDTVSVISANSKPSAIDPQDTVTNTNLNPIYYFYLPGSADIYANKFKTGDDHIHQPDFSPIAKISAYMDRFRFDRKVKSYIELDNFFSTELKAFNGAKDRYANHAITVFKIQISDEMMDVDDIKIGQQKTWVARPDIINHLISFKGLHTLKDNETTIAKAIVYDKIITADKVTFLKNNSDESDRKILGA